MTLNHEPLAEALAGITQQQQGELRAMLDRVVPGSAVPDRVAENAETEIVPLGPADVSEMVALLETAKPGPFASRTIELGTYVGVREGGAGRLIAMGKQRFQLDHHVELSAIAVHPEARGQGLGSAITAYLRRDKQGERPSSHPDRRATAYLARAVVARGRMPFLHVYPDNPAMALYARLGFRERARLWVLRRLPVRPSRRRRPLGVSAERILI